jgi:serine/threonine-protein kinase PRP4
LFLLIKLFSSLEVRMSASASPAPDGDAFALSKLEEEGDVERAAQNENAASGAQEQSAADYDPSMDRREDESRRVRGEIPANAPNINGDIVMVDDEGDMEEEEEEDVDDMFALATDEKQKKKRKVKQVTVSVNHLRA